MANNQHSYAKRQREIEKKRKADEKRARKLNKGKPAVDDTAVDDTAVGDTAVDDAAVDDASATVPPVE